MRKITAFVFVALLLAPSVYGDVNLEISSVIINKGITNELSNDTSYFGSIGQNGTIKVTIGDFSSSNEVSATIGALLTAPNGTALDSTIIQNKTVIVPQGGTNSGTLEYVISQSYVTGRYNITVFAEFPKNNDTNITIYDTSKYFNVVNLTFGPFYMKHNEKNFAPGDFVEFIQPVTNPGTIAVTPYNEISWYYDDEQDGFDGLDYVGEDSTGGSVPVLPDTTENRTYVWEVDASSYTCAQTEPTNDFNDTTPFMIKSLYQYGYSYTAYPNYQNPYYNRQYIYNVTYEHAKVGSGLTDYGEITSGDNLKALVDFENWGISDIIIHEAKAWLKYKDNGSIITDSVNTYTDRNYPGYGNSGCNLVIYNTAERLEFNFPNLDLSPSHDYEVVMAFDYGVPRTNYITVESFPYEGFNKQATTEFEFVEANLTNIYFREEVAYNVDPNFTVEVENIGINDIDLTPKVILGIENESFGYVWNQSSTLPLAAGEKSNKSFGWQPETGGSGSPLGSYIVWANYSYGLGGRTTKNSVIKIVSLGMNNVSNVTVAPYETTNVTFNIGNLGPTNATMESISAGIGSQPAISLGTQNDVELIQQENKSFVFSYYFDPPDGLTNGSYPINANLSYGGTTISDSRENITFLPVGIKSFSAPSQGNNQTYFISTLTLENLADSAQSVNLNLTSNLSGEINSTTVSLPASSTTTVNFNETLSVVGIHNLTIIANYSELPSPLARSGTLNITEQFPDLTITSSDISFSPSSPNTGDSVTINATASNTGDASASNFIVELIIDGTSQDNNTISVSPSSSTVTQFTWTAVVGTHDVTVVLDPTGAVTGELSEANNNATTTITATTPLAPSTPTSGGVGPSYLPTPTEPTYLKQDVKLTGKGIADLIYDSGDATADIKYVLHPSYASLAGVYSANGEVVLSEATSTSLFEAHKDSKSGKIIKKRPSVLEAGLYEISANYVMNTGGADTLVICRGDVEADSLAASTFTSLIDAKMLLVKPDEAPLEALQVLKEFTPTKVYIVGGEEAISNEVENKIGKYAFNIERIGGADRYETSLKLAEEVKELSDSTVAVVTDGKEPVIYAAALAVKLNSPVIYVDESSPDETDELLKDYKVQAKLY